MNLLTYFIGNQQKKNKLDVVLGQNMSQIRSNAVKKSKETGVNKRCLSYFAWGINFKAATSACTNKKFKENIARQAKFEGHLGQILA